MKAKTLEKIALYLIRNGAADTCARCARQFYCLENVEAEKAADCLKGMVEYIEEKERKNAATCDETEFLKVIKATDREKPPLAVKGA